MLVFITLLAFILLFLKLNNGKDSFSIISLKSILIFSFVAVIITEGLSLFNQINYWGVLFSWLTVLLILCCFFITNKQTINFKDFKRFLNQFSILEKSLLSLIGLIFILLFFQGIIYPPNNWDSLTYHMARIVFWLGNENINHYQTHILRQLYQPPFAEYLIMHVNLMQGNDYFSNAIQLLFLLFTLLSLNELLKWFKISRINRIYTLFFCLTIPSVFLQATTTKNDIVCAFFVVTSILFLIKSYEKPNANNFLFLGLAIGLGMLTKGTFYIYMFPALLLFLLFFVILILKQKIYNKIFLGLISVLLISLINIGHFSRNYALNDNVLSIDDTENKMYFNESMNLPFFTSNLLKNVGLNMGYPFTYDYELFLRKFHGKFSIDINNPQLNYLGTIYNAPWKYQTHEDLVANTIPFVLLFFTAFFLLVYSVKKKRYKILLLLSIITLQIIIFVFYLKWQPWHTRLHIPIFILGTLLIGITMQTSKIFNKIGLLLLPILIYSTGFYFLYNNLRPIITNHKYTKSIKISDNRFKKYFANQLFLYSEYKDISNLMDNTHPTKVGIILGDWQYPLFSSYYDEKIGIKSLFVNNITATIKENPENVDVIISDKFSPFIDYNGKKYMNKTGNHTYIWLYQ